jgi:hypothetical protein
MNRTQTSVASIPAARKDCRQMPTASARARSHMLAVELPLYTLSISRVGHSVPSRLTNMRRMFTQCPPPQIGRYATVSANQRFAQRDKARFHWKLVRPSGLLGTVVD